ncbi:Glycosyl phosphatidyl inositol protein transamidase complex subunit [Allomyces arbusculus]|nr:Glycosyl phosphatidyl inositol protein transamidase complex subunit [Allomyces arbusculus]
MAIAREYARQSRRRKLLAVLRGWAVPHLVVILVMAGIAAFMALPTMSELRKRAKVDENAFMPGHITTHYSMDDWKYIYDNEQETPYLKRSNRTAWVETELHFMGLEHYKHTTTACRVDETDCIESSSVYAIIRAPKGDGSEALALSASWEGSAVDKFGSSSPGVLLAMSLARFWKRYSYWAKDVIVVIGDHPTAITEWLHEYHHAKPGRPFRRAGSIQAAIHLDFDNNLFNSLGIEYDGYLGQLPNQDLILAMALIAQQANIHVSVHGAQLALGDSNDWTLVLRRLAYNVARQAQMSPCGPHAAFKQYGIDAITVRGLRELETWRTASISQMGAVLESMFRSLNNLIEKFHASYFFYQFLSIDSFIPILHFLPSTALLNVALIISAMNLWMRTDASAGSVPPPDATATPRSLAAPLRTLGTALVTGAVVHATSAHAPLSIAASLLMILIAPRLMRSKSTGQSVLLLACVGQALTASVTLSVMVVNWALALTMSAVLIVPWLLVPVAPPVLQWAAIVLSHPAVWIALATQYECVDMVQAGIETHPITSAATWLVVYPAHLAWIALATTSR